MTAFTTISPGTAQAIVNRQYAPGKIPAADWLAGYGLEAVQEAMESTAEHVFIFHRSEDDITVLVGWAAPEAVQLGLWA